ncbi:hypothetical protein L596_015523 [Steinernema carpocapsae]|uniref:Uncharacterized protein n=1 Tax=Steinernema carpocapsae TaxID=34508 RepID=A0A4U5NG52_STECR|nr:hypothetical protein L596_015523 [Steinernema carpocapsae]
MSSADCAFEDGELFSEEAPEEIIERLPCAYSPRTSIRFKRWWRERVNENEWNPEKRRRLSDFVDGFQEPDDRDQELRFVGTTSESGKFVFIAKELTPQPVDEEPEPLCPKPPSPPRPTSDSDFQPPLPVPPASRSTPQKGWVKHSEDDGCFCHIHCSVGSRSVHLAKNISKYALRREFNLLVEIDYEQRKHLKERKDHLRELKAIVRDTEMKVERLKATLNLF